MRANIYCLEPLTQEARTGIAEGIGMVATYIGQNVSSKELAVRLPLNDRGHVNPYKVGLGKLDKMVELHLMAVPLDRGQGEQIGLAGLGEGWSFVDISTDSRAVIRATAAHEVAHAFGFLSETAEHQDPDSKHHCGNDCCVMHKKVMILVNEAHREVEKIPEKRKLWDRLRGKDGVEVETIPVISRVIDRQYDFCLPCKVDMRDHGEQNLTQLRYERQFVRKSV